MHTIKIPSSGLVIMSLATLGWASGAALMQPIPIVSPAHVQNNAQTSVVQISAGGGHSCLLTSTGAVKCWGQNRNGQLGNGTTVYSGTPVDVNGLNTGVQAVAAGADHTCALVNDGSVRCWGRNYFGQLGNGTTSDSVLPVTVNGLSGVSAIAVGANHACAIAAGGLKCWGQNNEGQLGNSTWVDSGLPTGVSSLSSGVLSVTLGSVHTCAVTISVVQCWGRNLEGQLGDGGTISSSVPVSVTGLGSEVTTIRAGGYHTCIVTTSGGMKCWGSNHYHQLGIGSSDDGHIPSSVSSLTSGVHAIALGKFHTCAATDSGVKCWGFNGTGQLGNGSTADSDLPADVSGLSGNISLITAGDGHTCAATDAGIVSCWGRNAFGELGNGTIASSRSPVNVSGLTSVVAVASNYLHTCALTSEGGLGGDGGMKCWGNNDYGGLGDGTVWNSDVPVNVTGLNVNVIAIASGDWHSCALMRGGTVKCWGRNEQGQLGTGNFANTTVPADLSGLSGVSAISAGGYHTCALLGSGGVKCWGQAGYGQVGNGNLKDTSVPTDVAGLTSGVAEIEAGGYHTCARLIIGSVECWGLNEYGQLGNGATVNSSTPVTVSNLTDASALTSGDSHTCAVLTGGGVKCWGNNLFKQLGSDGNGFSSVPVSVNALSTSADLITSGGWHTCARASALDVLKCWGRNNYGQLGDSGPPGSYGTGNDSSVPITVTGLSGNIGALTAGDWHTCAVIGGNVKCWGSNDTGQLGDGKAWQTTPGTVVGFGPTPTPPPTTPVPTTPVPTTPVPTTPVPTTTVPPTGDAYEPDDTCDTARSIPTDGTVQFHTFGKQGDEDWLMFNVVSGTSYLLQAQVPPDAPTDVDMEMYQSCSSLPSATQNWAYAPGIRYKFMAPSTGSVFVRLRNTTASMFGTNVQYQVSVSTVSVTPPKGAVIIVAGRYNDTDTLQTNIYHEAEAMYRAFQYRGYTKDNIYYLTNDPSRLGANADATKDNLHKAITTWAVDKTGPNLPLTLYLIDHGSQGKFYLDNTRGEVLTPALLNDWLTQLETKYPGIRINIIIESCYSGSFIKGSAGSISKPGRVVLSSTSNEDVAWSSATGAEFSDHFLLGISQGQSLFDAFTSSKWAVETAYIHQTPFLDDNGDGVPNTVNDGVEAQRRGFTFANTFDDFVWPPYIHDVSVLTTTQTGTRTITATVQTNEEQSQVRLVYAKIYPPGYQPPATQDLWVVDNAPTVPLTDIGNHQYSLTYPGFTQPGTYRVVVFAIDTLNNPAQPVSTRLVNGGRIYLPLAVR